MMFEILCLLAEARAERRGSKEAGKLGGREARRLESKKAGKLGGRGAKRIENG
jgi:hypothetical protein